MRKSPSKATPVTTLEQPDEDAAYLAFLVDRANAGLRDPVRHSNEDVGAGVEVILAEHGA